MINEVLVVGDLKLREGAALGEYSRLGERMYNIVAIFRAFGRSRRSRPTTANK